MAAAFAFDQGAFATLGLRRTDGSLDPVGFATVGLMCLPAVVPPIPPTPPAPYVPRGGGGGGFSLVRTPLPCDPDDPTCNPDAEPLYEEPPVIEDVPLDLAIATAGDMTTPMGQLVADLALLFKKQHRE